MGVEGGARPSPGVSLLPSPSAGPAAASGSGLTGSGRGFQPQSSWQTSPLFTHIPLLSFLACKMVVFLQTPWSEEGRMISSGQWVVGRSAVCCFEAGAFLAGVRPQLRCLLAWR